MCTHLQVPGSSHRSFNAVAGGSRNLAIPRLPEGIGLERNKMRCWTSFCLLQASHECGSTRTRRHPVPTQTY